MRKLILFASLLMVSAGAFAQAAVGTLTVQPKVGLNVANITDDDDSDARIGLVAGAELEYQVTDIFSLSAGALYSMQGAKDKYEGIKATLQADYINIPILANVYVTKGLAVKAGIQPGFAVNKELKLSDGVDKVKIDADDAIKTFDFSIPVGLSYEYGGFVIDARYNLGLTKVWDIDDSKSKNSVFQFTVGYKFAL